MNLSLYSAATGMEAQQLNLNTIANNLANVNSRGFKRSKIEFQDMLYQKPRAAGAQNGGGNQLPTGIEVGNGTRVVATSKVFSQINNPAFYFIGVFNLTDLVVHWLGYILDFF